MIEETHFTNQSDTSEESFTSSAQQSENSAKGTKVSSKTSPFQWNWSCFGVEPYNIDQQHIQLRIPEQVNFIFLILFAVDQNIIYFMHNIYPIHFIVAHYIIYIYSCCYAFAPIYFGAKTTNRCIKKLLFLLDCHRPLRFLHLILNLSVLKIFLQLIQTQTIILNTIVCPLKEAHQEVGS